jgi:hypothetical protein
MMGTCLEVLFVLCNDVFKITLPSNQKGVNLMKRNGITCCGFSIFSVEACVFVNQTW